MNSLLLGVSALGLSYFAVTAVHRWTERHQILDIPNARSSHVRPIPRGGGLAIVGVTLGGTILFAITNRDVVSSGLVGYLIGAALIAIVGWVDDLHSLRAPTRLLTQGIGALLAIAGLGFVRSIELPLIGNFELGWLGLPLTWLWIVWLTNAFNFMDGIDGLLGSQAVLAGTGWAVLGWLISEPLVGTQGLLVAAGSLGFLGHNWPPARIFMGDVGSTFLGFTIAVIGMEATILHPVLASASLLLVWPLVFDTAYTLLRRIRKGENILGAHRSHLYQRLVIAGFSHAAVDRTYLALALVGIISAIAPELIAGWVGVVWIFVVPVLCFVLWLLVIYCEHKQQQPVGNATLTGYGGKR
jgi:UDP-N-acetylmuramyl pentapeptide phosphotransferase/UDP-N-acetylglucosamine-1-phosphate transferase